MAQNNASRPSLVKSMAGKYGIDPDKLLGILKATAFRQRDNQEITNEQLAALLVVADQYNLNPFTREIYAYPDKGGIVPVVGVDGWARMVNEHKQFNGVEFRYSENKVTPTGAQIQCYEWIECVIYRKDREHPTVIREELDECYRPPFESVSRNRKPYVVKGPWQTHTKRMLRHKAFVQCARLAFGFTGIFDEDEADNVIDMGAAVPANMPRQLENSKINAVVDALFQRCQELDNWGVADQYLEQKFQHADLEYARQRFSEVRSEQAMDITPQPESESQANAAQADQQRPMPDVSDEMLADDWEG